MVVATLVTLRDTGTAEVPATQGPSVDGRVM
jgi:hypothetical protein